MSQWQQENGTTALDFTFINYNIVAQSLTPTPKPISSKYKNADLIKQLKDGYLIVKILFRVSRLHP